MVSWADYDENEDLPNNQIPDTFDISTLLRTQNSDLDIEPVYIEASAMKVPSTEIHSDGSLLSVYFGGALEGVVGRKSMIINELKKIRHDTIANLLGPETDVPFSKIDPNYNLKSHKAWHEMSPDCWNEENRTLLELGSTRAVSEESLRKTYNTKLEKYAEPVVAALVNKIYILVVSTEGVFTNISLDQVVVDNLVVRMKMGLSLEVKVTNLLGKNIFLDDNSSMRVDLMRSILDQIKVIPDQKELEEFPNWIIGVSQAEQTPEARKRVIDIVTESFVKAKQTKRTDMDDVSVYISKFKPDECRMDQKRISVFPFVNVKRNEYERNMVALPEPNFVGTDVPSWLSEMWIQGYKKFISVDRSKTVDDSIKEAFQDDLPRHVWKQNQKFGVKFTKEQSVEAAKTGLWKKRVEEKWNPVELKEKALNDHKSFHPSTDTDDIQEFIKGDHLTGRLQGFMTHREYMPLIEKAKSFAQEKNPGSQLPSATDVWSDYIASSELVNFADFLGCVVEEVSLAMKHKCEEGQGLIKQMRFYDVLLWIVPSGTHVFVSCMFYKHSSKIIDTGRLGAGLYDIGDYLVSDPFSVNEVTMEHFCKAGPYMAAIMADMMGHFGIDPTKLNFQGFFNKEVQPQFWQTVKSIMLCYLNNKLDLEELITSQRYLFMNMFDDINPDPARHVSRLPEVIRSRMTVYMLRRTTDFMRHYSVHPIEKAYFKSNSGGESITFLNIMSLFCDGTVTLEQKISEFYFGYVVSKEKGRGSMKSFSICEKLYKEELKYLARDGPVLGKLDSPSPHRTDLDCLTRVIDVAKDCLKKIMGEDYMDQLEQDFLESLAKVSFSDLATLKASARKHVDDFVVDDHKITGADTVKKLLATLRKDQAEEFERRPKMLEALSTIVDVWSSKYGRPPRHVFEMAPFCLRELEKKGCFDSDLFPKSQHGGDREIHVLEVLIRILQMMVELLSKRICTRFKSEAITHPETKETFVPKHYKTAGVSYEDFITACKSADATKWCQNHHAVRFAFMLLRMTKPLFHGLIFRTLRLWTQKRINLPMELIAIFLKNKNTSTGNKTFDRMRTDFYKGNRPFCAPQSHRIMISSGMFQGILHYTSSLYHTAVQEFNRLVTMQIVFKELGVLPICDIIQSSDDTGMMLSVPTIRPRHELVEFMFIMMAWKEYFSLYLCIEISWAKAVILILWLLEFNSEWFLRQKVVRPRFRWVSACLETSMTDSFVARQRIFSNVLTQAAEGGASTFECALIQIAQAWMHYKILGLDTNPIFTAYKDRLLTYPDSSLGFFPLEPDLTAGITGYDYSLYLSTKGAFANGGFLAIDTVADVEHIRANEFQNTDKQKHLSGARLMFNNLSIWQGILERMKLESLESILSRVEKDPELVYGKKSTWQDDRITIALKMYSPGVKQSLSSHSPLIRMIVSSAYVLNRKCLMLRNKKERYSLYQLLIERISQSKTITLEETENRLSLLFPHRVEYDHLDSFLREFSKTAVAHDDVLTRRSKYKVSVFSAEEDDFSLVQICRRKWFSHDWLVPTGTTHFNVIWNITCEKFKFLRDTPEETGKVLGLNMVETRFFLESMSTKTRSVKLTDTAAKGKDLYAMLTRIFWPDKKLRSAAEPTGQLEIATLRSNLYSLLTFCFTNNFNRSTARRLISDCKALERQHNVVPREHKGLKIFYDFLNGVDKVLIISRLRHMKSGRVGFFSVRQKYHKDRRGYYGKGEWRGVISGVPCLVKMEDRDVTQIRIKSINDIDALAWNLSAMILEFRLQYPEEPVPCAGDIYLTPKGKFQVFRSLPSKMVPVQIDATLEVNILDAVSSAIWDIDTTPGSIRLIFKEGDASPNYTLYSESISSRDWVPDLPYLSNAGKVHEYFHKGVAMPLQDAQSFLNSLCPFSSTRRFDRLSMYRTTHQYRNYNIQALTRVLLKSCFPHYMTKEEINNYMSRVRQIQTMHFDITVGQIDSMMNEIASVPLDVDEINRVKNIVDLEVPYEEATNVQDEDLSSGHSIADIERLLDGLPKDTNSIEHLDRFLNEMRESGISRQEILELQESMSIGMTLMNPFMAYVVRIIEAETVGHSMEELLDKDGPNFSSATGQVLSLITLSDRCSGASGANEETLGAFEEGSDNDTYSLGSGHTVRRLQESINEITALSMNATGDVRMVLLHLRRTRQEQLAEMVEDTKIDVADFDLSNVPRPYFLQVLANKLIEFKKIPERVLEVTDIVSLPNLIKNMCLDKLLDMRTRLEVPDEEFARYKNSIKSTIMTDEFIDLICETFYISLLFNRDGDNIYKMTCANRDLQDENGRVITKYTLIYNMDLLEFN